MESYQRVHLDSSTYLCTLCVTALGERSGDTEALTRETEKLERQLAEVRQEVKAKDTLDKLLRGAITMDDVNPEDTNSLAHVIANHLNGMIVIVLRHVAGAVLSSGHCKKFLFSCAHCQCSTC